MTRRNLATELSELERLASHRGVDLSIARRREPVPHWAIEARAKLPAAPWTPFVPPDPESAVDHPVASVTEVGFLDAISKMNVELGKEPATYSLRPPLGPGSDSRGAAPGDGGTATPKVANAGTKVNP